MTPRERDLITKLHVVGHRMKGMYQVQLGTFKKMGHSVYPWANLASTMYGGGRAVAIIKHVRKHWTVKFYGEDVLKTTFKTQGDALLFIAQRLQSEGVMA